MKTITRRLGAAASTLALFTLAACQSPFTGQAHAQAPAAARPFDAVEVARFDEPWAMAFLPDGRLLVTERRGRLVLFDPKARSAVAVGGVPKVAYGGQGGLGDVALHPDFARTGIVYLSFAEADPAGGGARGAALLRAKLRLDGAGAPALEDGGVIWRQVPKVDGGGHYSHRIVFGPDGKLWLTSGERQKFAPAQDMASNLGKVLRLNDDGTPAADNPFAAQGGVAAQVWSLGHRNMLGFAFAPGGQPYVAEMGPAGGDEFNAVERGQNYGYPLVSDGDHYGGADIPDHATRPEFRKPLLTWTPVISPSSMTFYDGARFPAWKGSALIGGLSSRALLRVAVDARTGQAREVERFDMGQRIREVEQGADGSVWLLEDGRERDGGRLLRLEPKGR